MTFELAVFFINLSHCVLDPNLCDEKRTTQCDEYSVCCPLGKEQYGCCPFTDGTCCLGTSHCCPPGFSCTKTGTCKRTSTISDRVSPSSKNIKQNANDD